MITQVKIDKLEPNQGQIPGLPTNPRKWEQEDIDRLAASIEETPELLAARPLIVIASGDSYVVLGGNMRLAALKKLKRKNAPCYILPDDTPVDKMKEIVIKDNGSFGSWDAGALNDEWDDLPLGKWGVPDWGTDDAVEAGSSSHNSEVKEDDFDKEKDEVETRCKQGDIWALGDHRLMCGDSTDLESVKSLMGGGVSGCILNRSSI